MKTSRTFRLSVVILISLLTLACGLFSASDEVSDLQQTVESLSDQLATEIKDNVATEEGLVSTATMPVQSETTEVEPLSTSVPPLQPTEPGFENALTLLGQYGGSSFAVDVRGDYAYIGQGPRLVTLDISNPTAIEFISRSDLMTGVVQDVEVEGEYVYVTTRYSGLHVFDISQPDKPEHISAVEPENPGCGSMVLQDGKAFIACFASGLFIADVSTPTAPTVLSSNEIPGAMLAITVRDQTAYLVDARKEGVHVVDVGDPSNPQEVGFFDAGLIPSPNKVLPWSMDMCGGQLCLAVFNYGLVVLDVSDPTNPTMIGGQTPFSPSGIICDDDKAYLLSDIDGVRVFDLTDPTQPQQIGMMPTSVGGFEFTIQETVERNQYLADGKLFIPDQARGLTIVDVRDPRSPTRIGQYVSPVPDWMFDIEVVDKIAYVASRYAGLRIVDVTNPDNMVELAYDDERKDLHLQNPVDIDMYNDYALIADANTPFLLWDVSDPNSPKQIGGVYDDIATDSGDDLVVWGNYVYLSASGLQDAFYPGWGLWVIDISNPENPQAVNFIDLLNGEWSLSVQDGVLYALDGWTVKEDDAPLSLRVLDLSNAAQPTEILSMPIPDYQPLDPSAVIAQGDWLYMILGNQGLKLFDISEPRAPVEVPVSIEGIPFLSAQTMVVDGNTMIINGFIVLDISNPTAPFFTGMAFERMEPWTCDIEGDRVYVATRFHGIWVYELDRGD